VDEMSKKQDQTALETKLTPESERTLSNILVSIEYVNGKEALNYIGSFAGWDIIIDYATYQKALYDKITHFENEP
jgi:hypothetical protein